MGYSHLVKSNNPFFFVFLSAIEVFMYEFHDLRLIIS